MKKGLFGFIVLCASLIIAAGAQAAITVPTMPVVDIEAGATAVLALVGVFVVAGMVIKMLKRG